MELIRTPHLNLVRLVAAAIAAMFMLAAGGCAPGRMEDLADCGRVSVGVGLGLEAHAKVGCLTHPSLGVMSGTLRVGHENRGVTGFWGETQCVAPVATVSSYAFSHGKANALNVSHQRGRMLLVRTGSEADESSMGYWLPLLGSPKNLDGQPFEPLAFGNITDFEAGGTLVFVSARVGVNPLEIADFLLGFVGLDIAGDDPKPREIAPPPATQPVPDVREQPLLSHVVE